ncbi:MAG: hypothetical protein B7C24_18455 [Bacteroidetes bacterium 4572_77]|nr:MAG: hypothetical protein B7C24_18455 [Bacteroidetes bacterium 4572_77]
MKLYIESYRPKSWIYTGSNALLSNSLGYNVHFSALHPKRFLIPFEFQNYWYNADAAAMLIYKCNEIYQQICFTNGIIHNSKGEYFLQTRKNNSI